MSSPTNNNSKKGDLEHRFASVSIGSESLSRSNSQTGDYDHDYDDLDVQPALTSTTDATTPSSAASMNLSINTDFSMDDTATSNHQKNLGKTTHSYTMADIPSTRENSTASGAETSPDPKTPLKRDNVYKVAGYSPPEPQDGDVDSPLSVAHIPGLVSAPVSESVTALSGDKRAKVKAMLNFMKERNYHLFLEKGWDTEGYKNIFAAQGSSPWEVLVFAAKDAATDDLSPIGTRLKNVMLQGGDAAKKLQGEDNEVDIQTLESFLEKLPKWKNKETNPTIFNGGCHKIVVPLYRVQSKNCPICYLVVVSTAIFYRFFKPGKLLDSMDNVVNVNHYIRDVYEKERSFRYIFFGDGGFNDLAMEELLACWNPGTPKKNITKTIQLADWTESEKELTDVFDEFKKAMEYFGGATLAVTVFQEWLDQPDRETWSGSFSNYERLDPSVADGHAVLIVGAERTPGQFGGIKFFAQNSWRENMWLEFGLDLLLSMPVPKRDLGVLRFIGKKIQFGNLQPKVDGLRYLGHSPQSFGGAENDVEVEIIEAYEPWKPSPATAMTEATAKPPKSNIFLTSHHENPEIWTSGSRIVIEN